jgi:AraC-like DNA-binding protein
MSNQRAYSRIQLSTESFPEKERNEAWDHVYGRAFNPIETTTPAGRPLRANVTFHVLPEICAAFGSVTAHQSLTKRNQIENMGDVVTILGTRTNGGMAFFNKKAALFPKLGDFFVFRANTHHKCGATDTGEYVGASFSAGTLAKIAPRFRLNEAQLLSRTPYLMYLMDYIQLLESKTDVPDDMAHAVATHLKDLVALAIGSTRDIEHEAKGRGLMAARLKAAKDYIRNNLLDASLSDEAVARQLGVSPRYIRKLFTLDGSGGIYRYISEQRLEFAHRQLRRPATFGIKIFDMAQRCGFDDLSTFNRLFKAHFRMTPSEARAAARLEST